MDAKGGIHRACIRPVVNWGAVPAVGDCPNAAICAMDYLSRWGKQIVRQIWSFGRDQIVGLILAVLILLYQFHAGLIDTKQRHATELATLAYPYLTLLALYILFEIIRAPFVLDQQQRARIKELEIERDKRDAVSAQAVTRNALANHMSEAQTLMNRCFKQEDLDILEKAIVEWFNQLDAFLSSNLGASYVIRVRNHAGLPMQHFNPGSFRPNPREVELYGMLHTAVARLEEFSKELTRNV